MRKASAATLLIALLFGMAPAQTGQKPQKPKEESPEDVVRITTSLVQTDVVVTDKNEQIIPDLKMDDFELYDNGKKQDLKFMEFVSVETGRRAEGKPASAPVIVEADTATGLTPKEVKRIVAFFELPALYPVLIIINNLGNLLFARLATPVVIQDGVLIRF